MTKKMPSPQALESQASAAKVKADTAEAIGKRNGDFTNSAVVNKRGQAFSSAGRKDIAQPADFPNNAVDADTLFA